MVTSTRRSSFYIRGRLPNRFGGIDHLFREKKMASYLAKFWRHASRSKAVKVKRCSSLFNYRFCIDLRLIRDECKQRISFLFIIYKNYVKSHETENHKGGYWIRGLFVMQKFRENNSLFGKTENSFLEKISSNRFT